jgi:hypothetical protein
MRVVHGGNKRTDSKVVEVPFHSAILLTDGLDEDCRRCGERLLNIPYRLDQET